MLFSLSDGAPIRIGNVGPDSMDGYFPLAVEETSLGHSGIINDAITRAHFEVAHYRATHESEMGSGLMSEHDT